MVAKELMKLYKILSEKEQDKFLSMRNIYRRKQFFKMMGVSARPTGYAGFIEFWKEREKFPEKIKAYEREVKCTKNRK